VSAPGGREEARRRRPGDIRLLALPLLISWLYPPDSKREEVTKWVGRVIVTMGTMSARELTLASS
jgi:hypothetical protein